MTQPRDPFKLPTKPKVRGPETGGTEEEPTMGERALRLREKVLLQNAEAALVRDTINFGQTHTPTPAPEPPIRMNLDLSSMINNMQNQVMALQKQAHESSMHAITAEQKASSSALQVQVDNLREQLNDARASGGPTALLGFMREMKNVEREIRESIPQVALPEGDGGGAAMVALEIKKIDIELTKMKLDADERKLRFEAEMDDKREQRIWEREKYGQEREDRKDEKQQELTLERLKLTQASDLQKTRDKTLNSLLGGVLKTIDESMETAGVETPALQEGPAMASVECEECHYKEDVQAEADRWECPRCHKQYVASAG